MGQPAQNIETAALALPRSARLDLTLRLLDSIEDRVPRDSRRFDKDCVEEANRRYEAYLKGEEELIPGDQVFAELRAEED